MKIGDVTKHVISKSQRKRHFKDTQQVVYKTVVGKKGGKPLFSSKTRHEPV
jgi:hypothetical protein